MTDLTTNDEVGKQKSGLSALTGHTLSMAGSAFSPDGRRIVPAGGDNILKVWEAESGSLVAQVEFPGVARSRA
jgi:WD40 repeat protein